MTLMNKLLNWLSGLMHRFLTLMALDKRVESPSKPLPQPMAANAAAEHPAIALMPLTAYVSVVIPALNEAKRIAEVVAYALADPATAEVIVVDDSSIDDTVLLATRAGARVITSRMLGKGGSMEDGVGQARCDCVLYLDGDLSGLRAGIITDLCRPLVSGEADFVKARFGREGGRVTVLTAKPMLQIFFPELAHFAQPLGGIIAARKGLLQSLRFEDGYGVDIALLIDAYLAGAKLAEVDIGSLEHDSQPLLDLGVMANEVSRIIFSRAKEAGRLHVEQITAMYETQRQAAAGMNYVLTRRRGRERLLLLAMDGTLTRSSFAVELAGVTGLQEALAQLREGPDWHTCGVAVQNERMAQLFRFVHKQKFEQVARTMELQPGAIAFVNQMRRRGFMVGVVSDSYFVAAEIIRRRIFADFAMAHTIGFDGDVCNGQLRINPAFLPLPASVQSNGMEMDRPGSDVLPDVSPVTCKSHVLRCFLADSSHPSIKLSWVVGDNLNDLELLRLADQGFVIHAKSPILLNEPGIKPISAFTDVLAYVPNYEMVDHLET